MMKIELREFGGGVKTLEVFAEEHGLVMQVTERPKTLGLPRYIAHFKDIEIGGNGVLRSSSGNGETPEAAIAAYAREIEGQRLVYRAYQVDRRDFQAPNTLTVTSTQE